MKKKELGMAMSFMLAAETMGVEDTPSMTIQLDITKDLSRVVVSSPCMRVAGNLNKLLLTEDVMDGCCITFRESDDPDSLSFKVSVSKDDFQQLCTDPFIKSYVKIAISKSAGFEPENYPIYE